MLSNSGIDVDIFTGQPLARDADTRRKEQASKIVEEAHRNSQLLLNDLAGPGGEVLRLVLESLCRRLDELVAHDPQCQALMGVLAKVGFVARVAPKYAKAKASQMLGEDFNFDLAAPPEDTGEETA